MSKRTVDLMIYSCRTPTVVFDFLANLEYFVAGGGGTVRAHQHVPKLLYLGLHVVQGSVFVSRQCPLSTRKPRPHATGLAGPHSERELVAEDDALVAGGNITENYGLDRTLLHRSQNKSGMSPPRGTYTTGAAVQVRV